MFGCLCSGEGAVCVCFNTHHSGNIEDFRSVGKVWYELGRPYRRDIRSQISTQPHQDQCIYAPPPGPSTIPVVSRTEDAPPLGLPGRRGEPRVCMGHNTGVGIGNGWSAEHWMESIWD